MKQTSIITGAGKGLGFCITQRHLEAGDLVWALEYRITPELNALHEKYSGLVICPCDLSSTESVHSALTPLLKQNTPINFLYNVAGLYFPDDCVCLEESNIDRCLTLYNVNALGALRVMSALSPLLHSDSVIINVTSEAGSIGACTRTSEYGYCMSKAAANMGTKIFANQVRDRGIRVFCLHPGWMKTDMGGEKALLSQTSITPWESADALISIARNPNLIPSDIMYLDYRKTPLCW